MPNVEVACRRRHQFRTHRAMALAAVMLHAGEPRKLPPAAWPCVEACEAIAPAMAPESEAARSVPNAHLGLAPSQQIHVQRKAGIVFRGKRRSHLKSDPTLARNLHDIVLHSCSALRQG